MVVGRFFSTSTAYNASLTMRFGFYCVSGDTICLMKKNAQRMVCRLDYDAVLAKQVAWPSGVVTDVSARPPWDHTLLAKETIGGRPFTKNGARFMLTINSE